MQSALERWRGLLHARAQQMDAAYARLGRSSADFWDRRARAFHRVTKERIQRDPLYIKLSKVVTPQTTVLDVGAGTGRFVLALAPQAKQVIAVEPNATMLHYLQQDATEQKLGNITYVPTTWQDAPSDLKADIIICSHVLYPIWDIDTFLEHLRAATLGTCYVYMRAAHFDSLTADFWRHFHGDERCQPPGYIHALDVMYEMGIYANVDIVHIPQSMRFDSPEDAVERMLEELILPDDSQTRTELAKLLSPWLVEHDGLYYPPVREMVAAIIHW